MNQASVAGTNFEARSRSTTPAPPSLPLQPTPSVLTQPPQESQSENVESIGAHVAAPPTAIDESQEPEVTRTVVPSRSTNPPPIRPPPAGLPPANPVSSLLVRATVPSAAQATLEAPEGPLGHRRVPSHGSDRVILGGGLEDSQISEGATESELLDYVIPPTPTAPVASASASRPISPNVPSPSTPRFSESHSRRSASESISLHGAVTGNDNDTTSSSSHTQSSRTRPATSGSIGSWSDSTMPEVLERGSRQLQQSLVSVSTAFSSIAQRRRSGHPSGSGPPPSLPTSMQSAPVILPRLTEAPPTTAPSLGIPRNRALSQPGRRPSQTGVPTSQVLGVTPLESSSSTTAKQPIAPRSASDIRTLPRKISIPHSMAQVRTAANPNSMTPHSTQSGGMHVQAMVQQAASQPLPPSPPVDPLRRPFHLMSLLLTSMSSKQGGFLTRRLYIPHDVWSQGGAKLNNLSEKGKCVEALNAALEEVVTGSSDFFRTAGRSSAERWLKCLEEWSTVCEGVLSSVGKKLGVGESIISARRGGGVRSLTSSDVSCLSSDS